ncbi:uncharacterized protein LOC131953473 [Physella acuta]|uniref:uncharacterized protein LOC131953473 n=1 Tax=Physella acuta TaxID=109671 RepID=UPI0027DBD0E4|nr:uncharacterized protein LOC131953473 [Physella acuta]
MDNQSTFSSNSSLIQTNIQTDIQTLYLDPRLLDAFLLFNLFVSGTAGFMGIIGNVINIIVFYKLGYSDSVNIALTALAISDIGALVTLQVFNVLAAPWFLMLDLGFNVRDMVLLVAFYPHNYFIRVCGFITAYASLERCICVVSPLRVKQILTNKTAVVTIILIFILTTFDLFPLYYTIYLDWSLAPSTNKTILHIAFRQFSHSVFNISYYINDVTAPFITFSVIITSTSIIAVRLKSQARWRQSMNAVKSEGGISSRERKVVVMLCTISIMFVICLIPQSTILTAVSFVPVLSYGQKYFDIALMGYCVSYFSETTLSSANILIYLKMSQKYREQFSILFRGK